MLYPWQQDDWIRVTRESTRLPNAWLITGHAGIGKRSFAHYLAQWLLCDNKARQVQPCMVCESCHWFTTGAHPDVQCIRPASEEDEKEGKEGKRARKLPLITIDAVRDVFASAYLSTHRGSQRVILIEAAQALTLAAANALLKILEEPPASLLFILVAESAQRLLPTLRSRCRLFAMTFPAREQALAWLTKQGIAEPEVELAHHNGAPLFKYDPAVAELRQKFLGSLAQTRLVDCLALANELDKQKIALDVPIRWLQRWLIDLIKLRLAGEIQYYPDHQPALHLLSQRANLTRLMDYQNYLTEIIPFAQHTLNLRLQLEAILIEYLSMFTSPH